MVEFTITGEALWTRMERAVEKVNQRLRNTVQILETAQIPYAVVGGHAVRAWVAQVDEAALRTTQDVDILIRPADLPALIDVMSAAGLQHRQSMGADMFVEHAESSARDAVHILLTGQSVKDGEPYPDVEPSTRTESFSTLPFETLIRMKLDAFHLKDQVHLQDMISLGMIDESWKSRLGEKLGDRLQKLLDTPEG